MLFFCKKGGFVMKLFNSVINCVSSSDSIGIIGGADGPTAIIVSGNIDWFSLILSGLLIVGVIVLAVVLSKKKK